VRRAVALSVLIAALLVPQPARAYSVLAHEACVDALWDRAIEPLLKQKYPRATQADLNEAHAFAYGGSVIQDLGYYPFGSRLFTNLVHYIRSGDFVETLLRDARNVDELAFAIGALSHYATDNVGHPEGVNRSVPLVFPKLRAKFGDVVTYEDAPASHVIVEFSFDVVQVAAGSYLPEIYHRFVGFQVAKPLLERAFREVYGLEMQDLFPHEDLAISTYRKSVSELIPELTRVAWKDKRKEILALTPTVTESSFVYTYTRQQYEQEFGTGYLKPGWVARILGFFYRILPKFGPLEPLKFKPPTPAAQDRFEESFKDARARYGATLAELARGTLDLANTNFDTGEPVRPGTYRLVDETYATLLDRLADKAPGSVPAALRRNITAYYARQTTEAANPKDRKRLEKVREQLAALDGR
jgi:zinc dependent phospholipase C